MLTRGLSPCADKEKKISMVKHYKKRGIVFSIISIIVLIVGFFYQFEVDYSDYKRIKLVGGEGFYPDGYRVFHTEKEFLQSATYLYHGKDMLTGGLSPCEQNA